MSALRRRTGNALRQTRSPSPSPQGRLADHGEEVQLIPLSKLKNLTYRKRSKRRTGLIFGLGGLVGVLIAVFFANQKEGLRLEGLVDFNLDSLLDAIPAGIVRDARAITVRLSQRDALRKADRRRRRQSAMSSTTIPSPLDSTYNPRALVLITLSS